MQTALLIITREFTKKPATTAAAAACENKIKQPNWNKRTLFQQISRRGGEGVGNKVKYKQNGKVLTEITSSAK